MKLLQNLFFNQSFILYTFLIGMIFIQFYFFPNLLEDKDIKINDMSYLLPPKVNVIEGPITINPLPKEIIPEKTKQQPEVKPEEKPKVK